MLTINIKYDDELMDVVLRDEWAGEILERDTEMEIANFPEWLRTIKETYSAWKDNIVLGTIEYDA